MTLFRNPHPARARQARAIAAECARGQEWRKAAYWWSSAANHEADAASWYRGRLVAASGLAFGLLFGDVLAWWFR